MNDHRHAPAPATAAETSVPEFYSPENYRPEESVGYLMRRIGSAIAQHVTARLCEPGGPTFPQWAPLYKLHLGHATTVAELARECDLDAGAMTRLLDRLEAKGLCRRVRSLSDRRVVNIELTDEGREAARRVPHVLARVQNECLSGFSNDEWQAFKHYLERMLANVQALPLRSETDEQAPGS